LHFKKVGPQIFLAGQKKINADFDSRSNWSKKYFSEISERKQFKLALVLFHEISVKFQMKYYFCWP